MWHFKIKQEVIIGLYIKELYSFSSHDILSHNDLRDNPIIQIHHNQLILSCILYLPIPNPCFEWPQDQERPVQVDHNNMNVFIMWHEHLLCVFSLPVVNTSMITDQNIHRSGESAVILWL